jgi:O-methyltransferase
VNLIETVVPYTCLLPERLELIQNLAFRANDAKLDGDFVECGVMNGGSAAILAHYAKQSNRTTWLFDSFEGLPPTTEKDMPSIWGSYRQHRPWEEVKCLYAHDKCPFDEHFDDIPVEHQAGLEVSKCAGSLAQVKEVLFLVDADMSRVEIKKGWFQDTVPTTDVSKIAMLCLDSDWYESEKLCINKFYDSVVSGGFLYFDDYYFWPGCQKAIDEFFESRGEHPIFNKVHHAAWFQKK